MTLEEFKRGERIVRTVIAAIWLLTAGVAVDTGYHVYLKYYPQGEVTQ